MVFIQSSIDIFDRKIFYHANKKRNCVLNRKSVDIDLVEAYYKSIRAIPLLTKAEEIDYARRAQAGDLHARQQMINSNLRLVIKIARRYFKSGIPLLDLIEEGNLGLMHAVEKFDPERGFRFSTYSTWWIQQTIERAIMNQLRIVRIPVHVLKKPHEIAHEKTISIDDAYGESHLQDNQEKDPFHHFSEINLQKNINKWLAHLAPRHREVVCRRYGLQGHAPTTLHETGTAIGVKGEHVRQLQAEALKQLKHLIESDGESGRTLLN